MRTTLGLLLAATLFASAPLARAGDVTDTAGADLSAKKKAMGKVRIASIEGGQEVTVLHGTRQRLAPAGTELDSGDRVRTEDGTAAVLLYPDDSKITVMPKSEFQIEENLQGVQWNKLKTGQVMGAISKQAESQGGEKKIKFLIRTRTATMGVRGTEFVMGLDAAGNAAEVHTLEGSVEVAREETALLSGKGASVAQGQMVQATPGGVGQVQSFNQSEFVKSLQSQLPGSPASGAASGASSGASSAQSVLSSMLPSGSGGGGSPPPSLPPPRAVPPPALPPTAEELKAAADEKKEEEEKKVPHFHLVSFDLGGFFADGPDTQYRAASVHWTPSLRLPVLYFLTVRGSFGGNFAQNGSLYEPFTVRDFQVFVAFTLLKPLYAEAGIGEQVWVSPMNLDAGLATVNAGIILSDTKILNRVFAGESYYLGNPGFRQFRAGVGFQF